MAGFVNFLIGLVRLLINIVRVAIPIVGGIIVFTIVSAIVTPLVAGAFQSSIMVVMFAGVLAVLAGGFLAGICWR